MQTAPYRHRRKNTRAFGGQKKRRSSSSRRKPNSSGSNFRRTASRRGNGYGSQTHRGTRGTRRIPTFDPSQFINKNPTEVVEEVYVPKHKFSTFGLNSRLTRSINAMGLDIPSPIQDQVIPEILKGNDVIGLAETGTGKTAAFLIPLIEKTITEYGRETLVLAPTRELAIQIENELQKLTKHFKISSVTCVGGVNIKPQIRALKRHNHFIIGTPGRVLDLLQSKHMRTNDITTVVLDEADRMLDMGFIHDMRKILSFIKNDRETLFFSATMSKDIEALVHDFLKNPVTISVKKKDVTDSIEQDVVPFDASKKYETLVELLEDSNLRRVLIFGGMKHSVEKLSRQLSRDGIKAESIHGNKNHNQRQKSLSKFKSGNARVLVATDVAARGIHVDNVTHVINYDLPTSFEDYVHRIGRTGRAKERGKALTFVEKK